MEINREESEGKGKFFIEENGKQLALMTYKKSSEDKIIIDHTEVDESIQGEGIGNDLVEAVVKFARQNNFQIVPVCPFAKKVIDETPVFQDVLSA